MNRKLNEMNRLLIHELKKTDLSDYNYKIHGHLYGRCPKPSMDNDGVLLCRTSICAR